MNWNDVFSPDNLFFRILARGVDLVGLSLLYLVLCVPVVTIGPATAALYYTVVKCFRQGERDTFRRYLRAFRENLRQGVPATLICLAVGVPLFYGFIIMAGNSDSALGAVMYMAYDVALVVPLGVYCYLFPLMGRFRFSTRELFRTAFAMAMRHLPSTVVVVLLTLELTRFTLERWLPGLVTPVMAALLTSLFLERIFPKYLDVEQTAALKDMTVEEVQKEREKQQKPPGA